MELHISVLRLIRSASLSSGLVPVSAGRFLREGKRLVHGTLCVQVTLLAEVPKGMHPGLHQNSNPGCMVECRN